MAEISEKEYKLLSHNENISIIEDNDVVFIHTDNVYCYGPIDFRNGSEDMETLDTFDWCSHLYDKGVSIPANYDYETHSCKSSSKVYKTTETFKPSAICQYAHGFLGKPKYVVIYRE